MYGISLPALLWPMSGGRDHPIRGRQRGNTGTHELAQPRFYGKLADVGQALKKGDNVYVDGRIGQRQFIARDGNKPRTVHEIVASQCHVFAPLRRGNKAATRPPEKMLPIDR